MNGPLVARLMLVAPVSLMADTSYATQEARAYARASSVALSESGAACTTGGVEFWVSANLFVDDRETNLPVVLADGESDVFAIIDPGDCSTDRDTIFTLLTDEVATAFAEHFLGQEWRCIGTD